MFGKKVKGEPISSIIDSSMSVTGDISFKGKTRIDGQINGNITGEHLILSKDGKITGDVRVTSFFCQGAITGNIETKMFTAGKSASIHGTIITDNLTVEPGASVNGDIKAATKEPDSETAATKESETTASKETDSEINETASPPTSANSKKMTQNQSSTKKPIITDFGEGY